MIVNFLISFSIFTGSAQDSLPRLHNLIDDSISTVSPSFEKDLLRITMKNGDEYTYYHEDWDMEDEYPQLSMRLKEAIHRMSKVFVKAEHEPQFPGGDNAWQNYVRDFCKQHSDEIRNAGAGTVSVQFIVHMKGQITDVEQVGTGGSGALTKLAFQAVKESVPWKPAIQNGYQVVCYKKVQITLTP